MGIFLLAGSCERGGYLIRLWIREGQPLWYGIAGGIILVLYGMVATFTDSQFCEDICNLWWNFHCSVFIMGLDNRWGPTRQV
ncbi:hypothetical protein [Chitinophaga sancti]|uniref:hypothetical protein n=1 Tax=Chitinophaga sancti TaxID=1004 RepID=UPI0039BE713F